MEDKIKTFHCGVDVTYNTWVWVEASNEEEAEKKAILEARDNHRGDCFSYANVHSIYNDTE